MLRITEKKEGKKIKVFYLEGKIYQNWVRELQSEINKGIDEGEKIILDFSKVSYLDEKAVNMINRFPLQKVERRNASLFIRSILQTKSRGKK